MKKVKLYAPTVGVMEFDKDHAERILAKKPNGGWVEYKEEAKPAKRGSKPDKGNTTKPA